MRVVSESTKAEIDRKRTREALEWPIRALAANIIRMVRGAGRPTDFVGQLVSVMDAITEYQRAAGPYAPLDVGRILALTRPDEELIAKVGGDNIKQSDIDRWRADGTFDRLRAMDAICRGALQVSASKLVEQKTQERKGESEMLQGICGIEGWRQERLKSRKDLALVPKSKKKPRR